MQKLSTFFYAFKKSLINPSYFNDILRAPFSFSFKYFLMCALLFSLASAGIFTFKVQPKIEEIVQKAPEAIINAFPQDLVFYTQGGEWYINKQEPYIVPFPHFSAKEREQMELPKNLIVFYKEGTIGDVTQLDTLMLLNRKNMLTMGENGRIEATALGELPNGRLTRQEVERIVEESVPYLERIADWTLPIALAFIFVGSFVGQLVYLVWLGLLIWAVGRLMGKKVSYRKSYQLGIHAITLPWLLKVLMSLVLFDMPLPFWFTAVALVVAIFGISKVEETTVETVE